MAKKEKNEQSKAAAVKESPAKQNAKKAPAKKKSSGQKKPVQKKTPVKKSADAKAYQRASEQKRTQDSMFDIVSRFKESVELERAQEGIPSKKASQRRTKGKQGYRRFNYFHGAFGRRNR